MTEKDKTIELLLVDDEADFRRAATRALERQGFAVRQADSGERALEALGEGPPDVMVLDLRMEGMDGIDTLIELRKQLPDLPVVILTGHGRYLDALAGIRLEVVDFVQKPVDMRILAERIRAILARGAPSPMREKTVQELMTPPERFQRIYADQPVRELICGLAASLISPQTADPIGQPRRVVLVFDREERFLGLVRSDDILREVIPGYLLESDYASYFTGMFLAQVKVIGSRPIEEFIRQRAWVAPDAPLMEAVHVLVSACKHDLPVLAAGQLVGVIRGLEVFREIAIGMGIDIMARSSADPRRSGQEEV